MKSFQGKVSIVLTVVITSVIPVLAYLKLRNWPTYMSVFGAAIVLLYLLWIWAESRIAVSETTKGKTRLDRGTLELYSLARSAVILSALAIPSVWTSIGAWTAVGLVLFLAGVCLRLTAIRTLGKFYSHRVRINDDHQIITTGPYRYIRHPAYSGMLLANLGYLIFFFNYISLAVYLLLFVPVILLRISIEERELLAGLKGYDEFSRNRKKLIPFLW